MSVMNLETVIDREAGSTATVVPPFPPVLVAETTRGEPRLPHVPPGATGRITTAPQLQPREHGAYGILGVPLVAALIIARFDVVACLTALAAICGFLANEPLLIVTGRRGRRMQVFQSRAVGRLILLTVVAGVAGGSAFALGTLEVRVGLVISLLAVGVALTQSVLGMQRTLVAQVTAIMVLTLPAAVILLAGGLAVQLAGSLWLAWVLGRIATTAAVKSALASHRTATGHQVPLGNDLLQFGASLLCLLGIVWGFTAAVIVTPLLAAGLWLRIQRPAMQRIRTMGWALLTVNVISGLWMIGWHHW